MLIVGCLSSRFGSVQQLCRLVIAPFRGGPSQQIERVSSLGLARGRLERPYLLTSTTLPLIWSSFPATRCLGTRRCAMKRSSGSSDLRSSRPANPRTADVRSDSNGWRLPGAERPFSRPTAVAGKGEHSRMMTQLNERLLSAFVPRSGRSAFHRCRRSGRARLFNISRTQGARDVAQASRTDPTPGFDVHHRDGSGVNDGDHKATRWRTSTSRC